MIIEEREFWFGLKAPLRAWRLFRVRACEEGSVLWSPMYDDPDPTPWPRFKTAACNDDHEAPAPGCRCGIYAAVRGTLDSLPGYLIDTAHDDDPWAFVQVACSGRVFVDPRGVRAERAEIVRIAVPDSCWPDDATRARTCASLRERYGVAVGGLPEVPSWVTENLRDQGPPVEEDEELELRLGELELLN